MQHARKIWTHGHSAERRSIFLRNGFERAVQPAVFRGLQARRAGFHEVLRVEVRACEIGRARRVHDGELVLVKERLERSKARMQAKKPGEVDGSITIQLGVCKYRPRTPAATLGLRNRNAGTHAVVI